MNVLIYEILMGLLYHLGKMKRNHWKYVVYVNWNITYNLIDN